MSCFACGAIASHRHHSGQPSCKACSSFFRRSIGNKRMYKCKSETAKCDDRKVNKHGCQACRLYRCIDAGMDIELIPFAEMPQFSPNGIIQVLTRFWNFNYITRLNFLKQAGATTQKSYFEFEKTIATCKGALLAESDVMTTYIRNCDTLIGMNSNANIEEMVRAMFLSSWIAIEMVYRTVKNQGFAQRRVYFPDNSYLPVNENSLYHYYNSFGILFDPDTVAREGLQMLRSVVDASRRIFELKITEVEFSICSYLILLRTIGKLDRKNANNYKKQLDNVFRELQIEYNQGNKFDPALRIGDLILTLDLILSVKMGVERLLTCLSLHEKKSSNFFSTKIVEN